MIPNPDRLLKNAVRYGFIGLLLVVFLALNSALQHSLREGDETGAAGAADSSVAPLQAFPPPLPAALSASPQQAMAETEPSLADWSDSNHVHQLILQQRELYGAILSGAERQQFSEWVTRTEARAYQAVVAKAAQLGLSIGGIDADGRGYALIGFIAGKPIYTLTQNREAAISTAVHMVRRNAAFDPDFGAGIDGDGYWANINDHGEIFRHPEFNDATGSTRIDTAEVPSYTDGARAHMTHVAGTLAARGADARAMGMAPAARLHALIQQNTNHVYNFGMDRPGADARSVVGSTSLGTTDASGVYTAFSASFDMALRDTPYYLHFYAAANNGSDMESLSDSQNVSKNVVTVGSVSDVFRNPAGEISGGGTLWLGSSRGPTRDGRIKPEIVANGVGLYSPNSESGYGLMTGTSMATPNASGSALLLVDYFRKRFPDHYLRATTLKALIINTAEDRGLPGPDYSHGFGLMNTYLAARAIRDFADQPQTATLVEDRLASGQVWNHAYASDGTTAVRITLTWADPAGPHLQGETRAPMLVNDLHLRVRAPDGTLHYPFVMPFVSGQNGIPAFDPQLYQAPATTGINSTDTVEQLLIAHPAAGIYTVEIYHGGSLQHGFQDFSLAISGLAQSGPSAAATVSSWTQRGSPMEMAPMEILGSGFRMGTRVLLRRPDAETAAGHYEVSPDHIRSVIDTRELPPGYWDVVVQLPDGTETLLANGFFIPAYSAEMVQQVLYAVDFESPAPLLALGDGWEIGPPDQAAIGGPGSAASGVNVLGTYLDGGYQHNLHTHAVLGPLDTRHQAAMNLHFQRWLGIAFRSSGWFFNRHYDYARIAASTDANQWVQLWSTNSAIADSGWSAQSLPLPEWLNDQPVVYLRFSLQTDNSQVSFGWNIDDLRLLSTGRRLLVPSVITHVVLPVAMEQVVYTTQLYAEVTDVDPGLLQWSLLSAPPWLSLQPGSVRGSARLQGTPPPESAGQHPLSIRIDDGTYRSYAQFNLHVEPFSPPLENPADGLSLLVRRAFGIKTDAPPSAVASLPRIASHASEPDAAGTYLRLHFHRISGGTSLPDGSYRADNLSYQLLLANALDDIDGWLHDSHSWQLAEPPVPAGDGYESVILQRLYPDDGMASPVFFRFKISAHD